MGGCSRLRKMLAVCAPGTQREGRGPRRTHVTPLAAARTDEERLRRNAGNQSEFEEDDDWLKPLRESFDPLLRRSRAGALLRAACDSGIVTGVGTTRRPSSGIVYANLVFAICRAIGEVNPETSDVPGQ